MRKVLAAARCHVWFLQSRDSAAKAAQASTLMSLAHGSGIPAILYHSTFYTELAIFELTPSLIWSTLAFTVLGVFVTLLFLMPLLLAAMAACSVAGVYAVLLGYMAISNIAFNATTLCLIVIGAGFCVDYFTHVCFFAVSSLTGPATWRARMRRSLERCGYAVFQAGNGQFSLGQFLWQSAS